MDQTYNVCLLSKARTAGRRSTCLGRQTQLRNPDGTGKPRTKTPMLGREPQHRIQWGHARSTRPRMRQEGESDSDETATTKARRGERRIPVERDGREGEEKLSQMAKELPRLLTLLVRLLLGSRSKSGSSRAATIGGGRTPGHPT